MHIDKLINQVVNPSGEDVLIIPSEWSQGRTVFGGLSAALLFAVTESKVTPERLVRSFHCNFIAPFFVEHEYTIKVVLLREGKNVSVLQGSIIQNNIICVQTQTVFGAKRQSMLAVKNTEVHNLELPKEPSLLVQTPKLTPKALQHFEMAIVDGIPFTGSTETTVSGWMRFKKSPESLGCAHLIALIDAWPPTLLQQLQIPAPASSMTWTINFIQPLPTLSSKEWFAYQAKTREFSDGYGVSDANIWDEKGKLLATSNQIFTLFV